MSWHFTYHVHHEGGCDKYRSAWSVKHKQPTSMLPIPLLLWKFAMKNEQSLDNLHTCKRIHNKQSIYTITFTQWSQFYGRLSVISDPCLSVPLLMQDDMFYQSILSIRQFFMARKAHDLYYIVYRTTFTCKYRNSWSIFPHLFFKVMFLYTPSYTCIHKYICTPACSYTHAFSHTRIKYTHIK